MPPCWASTPQRAEKPTTGPFPRIKDVRDLLKASRGGKEFLVIAHLIAKSRDRLCCSAFIAVGALATLGATFRYSDSSGRSARAGDAVCLRVRPTPVSVLRCQASRVSAQAASTDPPYPCWR